MEVKITHEPGYVLARPTGRIDEAAEDAFRAHLFPLVGQAGARLVLDLSQAGFISSRGLAQLVSLAAHANTHSSRVVLAACPSFVAIVISRCKLDRFFEMADSVPDAVRMVLEESAPIEP